MTPPESTALRAATAEPATALESLAASYSRGVLISVEEHQFWREIKQFYGRAEQLQAATLDWLGGLSV